MGQGAQWVIWSNVAAPAGSSQSMGHRIASQCFWDISREGDSTASLGNLFQSQADLGLLGCTTDRNTWENLRKLELYPPTAVGKPPREHVMLETLLAGTLPPLRPQTLHDPAANPTEKTRSQTEVWPRSTESRGSSLSVTRCSHPTLWPDSNSCRS